MKLLPIDIDISKHERFTANPECVEILNVYPAYYEKVGYNPPWIGYFTTNDDVEIIGCGGYKGKPRNGTIEIAYGTFKNFQGKGIGTEICRQLVALALKTDPSLRITARTLRQTSASTTILQRNNFKFVGTVFDDDDGDVWEWEYQKSN
ncbi:MAG: GNAT family N-acetyltransferase [Chitinophagaceae bacterium]|nr:GNAT family N-acetyltransferase [Chitinophagaceae bacterium]